MMAAQLIAAHNTDGERTFEGRRENLAQANKLSRTDATLLEGLNRHRGKGQQKVTRGPCPSSFRRAGRSAWWKRPGVEIEQNRRINPRTRICTWRRDAEHGRETASLPVTRDEEHGTLYRTGARSLQGFLAADSVTNCTMRLSRCELVSCVVRCRFVMKTLPPVKGFWSLTMYWGILSGACSSSLSRHRHWCRHPSKLV
jgi:hypothetical protein